MGKELNTSCMLMMLPLLFCFDLYSMLLLLSDNNTQGEKPNNKEFKNRDFFK